MSFFGLMTVKPHDALLEARQELNFQKGQVANLHMRFSEETVRADLAEQRVDRLLDEIKALRPDAEKYRERCRRDREHAAAKRARSNGNLIPGGPKKKAAVMAERAGSVG